MADLNKVLKDEMRRIARSEASAETAAIKKSLIALRKTVSALNKENAQLRKDVAALKKASGKSMGALPKAKKMKRGPRFTATSIKRQRTKLGLSQGQFAALLGVSTLSVCNWETGKARPRAETADKILATRQVGRRQAREILATKGIEISGRRDVKIRKKRKAKAA